MKPASSAPNAAPRRLQRQAGTAAIEMAILVTVLVPLTLGVTELGRAMYEYNSLAKATRDAARYLSSQGPNDAADIAIAKCLAVYGTQDCSGSVLVPGLTTAMVAVCDSVSCAGSHANQATGSGVINLVTVTVSGYTFMPVVPLPVFTNLGGTSITFSDISTTMRQIL
jgi:Flp pilus assembly protein TadG